MDIISTHSQSLKTSRMAAIVAVTITVLSGCRGFTLSSPSIGPYCLPPITLTDQNGHQVSLESLKGKPILFDFIYTRCPGPCLLITAKMKNIAEALGPKLGPDVRFVSVSVDPEHDTPADMLSYANEMGIKNPNWLFLTGPPPRIDSLMSRFKLIRAREPNGAVDHVLEFFLVGSDGHLVAQYVAIGANATKIANDLEAVAAGQQLALNAAPGADARF